MLPSPPSHSNTTTGAKAVTLVTAAESNGDDISSSQWTPLSVRLNQALIKKDLRKSQQDAVTALLYQNLPYLRSELVTSMTTHKNNANTSNTCHTGSGAMTAMSSVQEKDNFRSFAREIKSLKETHLELILSKLLNTFITDKKDFLDNIDSARDRDEDRVSRQFIHQQVTEGTPHAAAVPPPPLRRVVSKYSGRMSHIEAEIQRVKGMPSDSRTDGAKEFLTRRKRQLLPSLMTGGSHSASKEQDEDARVDGHSRQDNIESESDLLRWRNLSDQLKLPLSLVSRVAERMMKENEVALRF